MRKGLLRVAAAGLLITGAHGGEARISPRELPGGAGIKSVTWHTDGEKLNRLNAFRDAKGVSKFPELYGGENEFPPVATIETVGPGTLELRASPCGDTTTVTLKTGGWSVEIYPDWDTNTLGNKLLKSEELTISWNEREEYRTKLEWSRPREIFLNPKRMNDITVLAAAETQGWDSWEGFLLAWEEGRKRGWKYEAPSVREGWQSVPEERTMRMEQRGDCLSISVMLAGRGLRSGWDPAIAVGKDHAIARVKNLWIEGTQWLVRGEESPETLVGAKQGGQESLRKIAEEGGKTIEISAWLEIYRLNGR